MDHSDCYLAHRILADGRLVGVFPLTYGRARIVIADGPEEWHGYSDGW